MKLRKLLGIGASALVMIGMAEVASAHALSIGYQNAGPGSVEIFMGTYSSGHASNSLEGSMQLVGVNGNAYPLTTVAFSNLVLGAKPGGLIDGVTNFFDPGPQFGPNNDPLINSNGWVALHGSSYAVDHWQGATFAGLTPGDYQFTYIPINNPSQEWTPANSNMNGTFTLTGTVVNGVPVGGSGLLMLGFALLGLTGIKRFGKA